MRAEKAMNFSFSLSAKKKEQKSFLQDIKFSKRSVNYEFYFFYKKNDNTPGEILQKLEQYSTQNIRLQVCRASKSRPLL